MTKFTPSPHLIALMQTVATLPVFLVDLFSRMVVGWAMAAREDEQLIELALRMAVVKRHLPTGLLHHSDRGSECTSDRYLTLLSDLGIEVSIGGTWNRRANCYDNAANDILLQTSFVLT